MLCPPLRHATPPGQAERLDSHRQRRLEPNTFFIGAEAPRLRAPHFYYQPIVYALPKEDWNAFREWTKQAVTFQPTLYQQIAELTTKKESEAYTDEIWNEIRSWAEDVTGNVQKTAESIVPRVQTLLNQNKELLEQDGRMREQFISGLDLKETNRIKEFKNLLTGMKRWIITAIASTIGGSAILSTVICLLMR